MPAFPDALGDRAPVVSFAIPQSATQRGRRLVWIAKLGWDGVDRVRIDTTREDATVAVENLSPLCWRRNRSRLLPVRSSREIGVPKYL